jgi:hypothetical protein
MLIHSHAYTYTRARTYINSASEYFVDQTKVTAATDATLRFNGFFSGSDDAAAADAAAANNNNNNDDDDDDFDDDDDVDGGGGRGVRTVIARVW